MTKLNRVAQGEVTIIPHVVATLPQGLVPHAERDRLGRPIIAHSESGHHHVLERPVEVYAKPNTAAGLQVLYALLDRPTDLVQDASDAHGKQTLPAGLIEFRIAREFDPFSEQVRRVAD